MNQWFIVPLVEQDVPEGFPEGPEPPKQPKYADLVDDFQSNEIPNEDNAVVLFDASEEVIEQIRQNEDVEELSEVEAARLRHEISQEQDAPAFDSPINPGEGETAEERLNNVISQVEEGLTIGGPGVTVAEPAISVGDQLFLDQPIELLSYSENVTLARQLVDLLLKPEASIISGEQNQYINWISELVQYVSRNSNLFDQFTQGGPRQPTFGGIMGDYHLMTDHLLMPLHFGGLDNRVQQFIRSVTGLSGPVDITTNYRIFGPFSLALLDGLIKRRCPDIGLDNGNLQSGAVELTWRPSSPRESSLSYHDRLQYWRHNVARQEIKKVLEEINDLTRHRESYLRNIAGIMGNEDILDRELESTEHFLAVLSSQRHFNMHGQGTSLVITPLALNLCNLIFLDFLGEDNFDKYHEMYLGDARQ
jgi:hypothetical protein